MTNEQLIGLVKQYYSEAENNMIFLPSEGISIRMVDEPLIGFAAADDPIFCRFKDPDAIGSVFKKPEEYLPGAKTVIAFFYPFTEEIRDRHRASRGPVDEAWSNGYPGSGVVLDFVMDKLQKKLEEENIRSCRPAKDPDNIIDRIPTVEGGRDALHFAVSWSNRHACYAAGLGTFGIHRHIITEKGCCGTLDSLIIDAPLAPTPRRYEGIYDNCIHCNECVGRCPAGAIDAGHLRNLKICAGQSAHIRELGLSGPCGKCLVGVPCEAKNPQA